MLIASFCLLYALLIFSMNLKLFDPLRFCIIVVADWEFVRLILILVNLHDIFVQIDGFSLDLVFLARFVILLKLMRGCK